MKNASRSGSRRPQSPTMQPSGDVHFVFGIHPVEECLAAGTVRQVMASSSAPAALLAAARRAQVPVERVLSAELDAWTGGAVHQGVAALVDGFVYTDFSQLVRLGEFSRPPVLVFLDRITDPQNLGAIARSALLLGARGLVIPLHESAHVTPGAMKASAGALAHFPVARVPNLKNAILEARQEGWFAVGAAGQAAVEMSDLDLRRPLALAVGSEHQGLRPGVAAACDVLARIPMAGQKVGSYNASVAAGICLYEIFRQNRPLLKG